MSNYTLEVIIDRSQLDWLSENGFRLCIARQISPGQYNVLLESRDLSPNTTFSWQDSFETFWTNNFQSGVMVMSQSNMANIAYGQTVTIQPDAMMSNATGTPNPDGKLHVVNNFTQPVHVGLSVSIDGRFQPCYVSRDQLGFGQIVELEPVKAVLVWLQQNAPRGIMIDRPAAAAYEVHYDGTTDQKITYTGPVPGQGSWQPFGGGGLLSNSAPPTTLTTTESTYS